MVVPCFLSNYQYKKGNTVTQSPVYFITRCFTMFKNTWAEPFAKLDKTFMLFFKLVFQTDSYIPQYINQFWYHDIFHYYHNSFQKYSNCQVSWLEMDCVCFNLSISVNIFCFKPNTCTNILIQHVRCLYVKEIFCFCRFLAAVKYISDL